MKRIMRVKTVFTILCFGILLTECGDKTQKGGINIRNNESDNTVSSLTVNKDGSISSTIIEDFGENYYNADELKSMIESNIADCKKTDAAAEISLKSFKAQDSAVNVQMEFGSYNAYSQFYDCKFFAGTIQDANKAGFDLNTTLQSVAENVEKTSISKPELLGMGDKHIVIVDTSAFEEEESPIRIKCYNDILYVGEGVKAVSEKEADVEVTGGYGFIVFK